MGLTVPNPTVPTNGQALDATPLLANLAAVYAAIQSFDASQIAAGTLVAAAFATSINPNTILSEVTRNFVASGLVWSADSAGVTLAGSMTSGVLYYSGVRVAVNSISAHAFTASKDTYVDISNLGTVTYTEVTNNAASPAMTANSIRVAIVVTGAGSIAAAASINQGQEDRVLPIASSIPYAVTDSLGDLICPRDPNSKLLGYRQITSTFVLSASQTTPTQITGLTCPVIVPTGRKIKVTTYCGNLLPAGGVANMSVWDGVVNSGTQIQSGNTWSTSGGVAMVGVMATPSTASKTYNAGTVNTGANNVTVTAGATQPAYIQVELE